MAKPAFPIVIVLCLVVAACGSSGSTTTQDTSPADGEEVAATGPGTETEFCGQINADPLDPTTLNHVLPNAPPVSYLLDPPSSGAHQPIGLPASVLSEPLTGAQQVSVLESGAVLAQHDGLDDAAIAELEALAGGALIVAPYPGIDDPIVLTAWLRTQRCDDVDPAAIEAFVFSMANRVDQHPESAADG